VSFFSLLSRDVDNTAQGFNFWKDMWYPF